MNDSLYKDCGWEHWPINECDRETGISTFIGAWSMVMMEALERWLQENLTSEAIQC